jgi:hypothetical protein
MNNRALKLSDEIFTEASKYANVFSRSVPKQIEYWTRIGKIMEENPDLTYNFVKDILLAKEEMKKEKPTEYKFG